MIVLDSSALIAVINQEPERQSFLEIIASADRCLISAVTLLETKLVTFSRFGEAGIKKLDAWLETFAPEIIAFDEAAAAAAFSAYLTYGKGVHPKASVASRLN